MLERVVQRKAIIALERKGWYVLRLVKTNKSGIPDVVCFKQGRVMWVEFKAKSGRLSEIQRYRIKELENNKMIVVIWQG
jgi:Holliday junction resolvase